MDWMDFAVRFGIPTFFLGIFSWIVYKDVWPFFKAILENERTARAKEHEGFIAALSVRDEQNQRMLLALDKLTDAVDDIRQGMRKR